MRARRIREASSRHCQLVSLASVSRGSGLISSLCTNLKLGLTPRTNFKLGLTPRMTPRRPDPQDDEAFHAPG